MIKSSGVDAAAVAGKGASRWFGLNMKWVDRSDLGLSVLQPHRLGWSNTSKRE